MSILGIVSFWIFGILSQSSFESSTRGWRFGEIRVQLLCTRRRGGGKTLFARKLADDFRSTQTQLGRGEALLPTRDNLWHRVTGSHGLSPNAIATATLQTEILSIEDDRGWVETATKWAIANKGRRCVILVDNAERQYFRQGLLAMSDAEYVKLADEPRTMALASERLVALCRSELRGCLFVILTNNDLFALGLDENVNAQHAGLLSVKALPLPGSQEKETVVRVNTNRLNGISYWFCLDKAGPEEKMAVYAALRGASTFPDSFAAVDAAIRNATPTRMGRPARKCVVTLVVLTRDAAVPESELRSIGAGAEQEMAHQWVSVWRYESGWARAILAKERDAALLESEWQLRVAVLGRPFANSLLSGSELGLDACRRLLEVLERIHGPGTRQTTRDATAGDLGRIVDSWVDVPELDADFWEKGRERSAQYEAQLRRIYADYDVGQSGFCRIGPTMLLSRTRRVHFWRRPLGILRTSIRRFGAMLMFLSSRQYVRFLRQPVSHTSKANCRTMWISCVSNKG